MRVWKARLLTVIPVVLITLTGCGAGQDSDQATGESASDRLAEQLARSDAQLQGQAGDFEGRGQPPTQQPPSRTPTDPADPVGSSGSGSSHPTPHLPDDWPDEVPVPPDSSVVSAGEAPDGQDGAFYAFLRVAGGLDEVVATLDATLGDAGFDRLSPEVSAPFARVEGTANGMRVIIELHDDGFGVVDVSYQVTAG